MRKVVVKSKKDQILPITILIFLSFCFFVSFSYNDEVYAKNPKVIKIGTGNKEALAYPIISAICEVFNKNTPDKTISCQAIETGGSEDNLNGIINGKFDAGVLKYDAGVIKADMVYNAYNGIGIFAGRPYKELRTIFGLHNEYLTIIVKNNSGINNFQDLKNKRIYIGNIGSGSRILVEKLFKDIGWKKSNFKELNEEEPREIYNLFCKNKIDGAIYLVGHPNSIFIKTLRDCETKLISFSRKELEEYIDSFSNISLNVIKKGTYTNQMEDINTFTSQLLLVTSTKLDKEIIDIFIKVVSEHYPELQQRNPLLKSVSLFGPEINVIPLYK